MTVLKRHFNSSLTLSLTWFVNEDNDNSYEDYLTKEI